MIKEEHIAYCVVFLQADSQLCTGEMLYHCVMSPEQVMHCADMSWHQD